jgi:hypothetical protein
MKGQERTGKERKAKIKKEMLSRAEPLVELKHDILPMAVSKQNALPTSL